MTSAPAGAAPPPPSTGPLAKPGALVDLGLTLPIFVAYHLGVVFLDVRNGTDVVTGELLAVSENNRNLYLLYTMAIGVVFASVFGWLGRGQAFRTGKFVQIALEGALYAFLMRLGGAWVVTKLFLATQGAVKDQGRFVGVIMSLGAGFYEELTFRVLLFGVGAKVAVALTTGERLGFLRSSGTPLSARGFFVIVGWALVAAAVFSGVHYVGALGDRFDALSFTFRLVLGLCLTLVFGLRGFAAAVWTHALYDIWVLVF